MDGVAEGKPGLARFGGVLRNCKREVLYMFSKNVGVRGSNKAQVLAILEAGRFFACSF